MEIPLPFKSFGLVLNVANSVLPYTLRRRRLGSASLPRGTVLALCVR